MESTRRIDEATFLRTRPQKRPFTNNSNRGKLQATPDIAIDDVNYFVERDGLRFAGTHLIVDLWKASYLDDLEVVETALRDSAAAAGATLLKLDLHGFEPSGGITGVALLAESHISIHTWPERAYAALDLFMCGNAMPHKAIDVFKQAFRPGLLSLCEHKRGVMP